jgi:DNA-binding FrmR family transcriptional regulator
MAEYATTPQLVITDTFTTLVTDFNTVSSGLGATGDLTTNVKTTIVGAINELEVGIRGTSNNLVATDLTTTANDLVGAINEIEGVFDASAKGISAGSDAFDITTTHASGISLAAPITSLTGHLSVVDNKEIRVGTGDDLIVLHDATNSIIKGDSIYIKAKSADENMASFTYNGAVNLYHDNVSRIATTATGVSVPQDLELGASSVIKSGGNAAITFANANVTMGGNISIAGTVDGRDVSTDGTKLDGIEDNATADQTDAEIRAAVEAATNSNVFTDADHSKLNGIEASADVTDTANVTAAGALMDSELTDLAGVKGVTISTLQPKPSEGAFVDGDKTKLDAIEASATADQTASEILTAIKTVDGAGTGLDADLLDGQHGSYYATAASVGTLSSLDNAITVDRTNLVAAINELQGDITQINTNGASANNTIIGTLSQMLTSEDSDVVGAINELHTETLANTTKLSGIEAGANVTDTANVFASLVEGNGIDLDSSTGTISSALVTATSDTLGLVKIGYSENGQNYPVELSSGKMFVNVPWNSDTNTQNTYSTSVVSSSGIKLRLTGAGHDGATTDDVKFVGAGSSTVSRTDASTITITSTDTNTQLSTEQVQDIVGGMLGGTETGITVTYQDGTGDIDFVVATQTDNNFTTALKNKLDAIEASATADQTAAQILTAIKTVDGSGSGLDADLLDGNSSAHYATAASVPLVFNAAGTQLN